MFGILNQMHMDVLFLNRRSHLYYRFKLDLFRTHTHKQTYKEGDKYKVSNQERTKVKLSKAYSSLLLAL